MVAPAGAGAQRDLLLDCHVVTDAQNLMTAAVLRLNRGWSRTSGAMLDETRIDARWDLVAIHGQLPVATAGRPNGEETRIMPLGYWRVVGVNLFALR